MHGRFDHLSSSKDTHIRVWDRASLQPFQTLSGHDGPVNAVGLQDDKVVSASGDGKIMLWDIPTGERLRTFEGHDRGLACIEFRGDLIISGSNDKKIKIWSASTGECIQTLTGHEQLVRALSFDPGTMRLVSASYDRSIKVWDLKGGPGAAKCVREFKNAHDSHIFDVKARVGRIVRLVILFSLHRTLADNVRTAPRTTKRLSLWISLLIWTPSFLHERTCCMVYHTHLYIPHVHSLVFASCH